MAETDRPINHPSDPDDVTMFAVSEERIGSTIDRYTLIEQLGEGGFGTVYRAEQKVPVRRQVALKIIKLGMDTKQVIARFEAERQALALMEHPNIAGVLDAGATESGRPYFVMELVRGVPITEYCDRQNVSTGERLRLFIETCLAVQHAHQKGIIHRDLKPSNILVAMLDGKPVPKVIDFGIAKATNARLTEQTMVTQQGQFIGTPEYMSPEQADSRGLDIDTRSDVYSLGVVLYELLTGSTPFTSHELRSAAYDELLRIIREQDPPSPSTRLSTLGDDASEIAKRHRAEVDHLVRALRGDLDWIVMKALDKDRVRRYPTAKDFADDIERHLTNRPVEASPPSVSYRISKFIRRHRVGVGVAAVVAMALITGVAAATVGFVSAVRAREAEVEARQAEQKQREVAEFKADEALRQANVARAAIDFVNEDLLAAVDPANARGRDITMREVLDEASRRLGGRFSGEPLVGAAVHRTLGRTYLELGEYDAAAPHLERTLTLRRQELGEDHRDTLEALTDLGMLAYRRGEFRKAEQMLRDAAAAQRAALGEDDLLAVETDSTLAVLLAQQGRLGEALPLLEGGLETRRRLLDAESHDTLSSANNLAMLYADMNRMEDAEALYRESLEILDRTLGRDHPDTLMTRSNFAWMLYAMSRFDDAEPLNVEVLEARRRILGNDHPETMTSINNLAVLYRQTGRSDLAEPLYLEGLEGARRVLGSEHPDTVIAIANMGRFYVAQKQHDQALPLLEEAIEVQRRTLPAEFIGTGITLQSYGECLSGLERHDEAIEALLESHTILSANLAPGHIGLVKLAEALVTSYAAIGDESQAAVWRQRLADGNADDV